MIKYKCIFISGDGKENNAGIWEKIETPKTITFRQVEEGWLENYTLIKINKFYSRKKLRKDNNYNAFREMNNEFGKYIAWMNNGHVLRDWLDGTFTAYPEQCGTPYVFTPILEGKSEEISRNRIPSSF